MPQLDISKALYASASIPETTEYLWLPHPVRLLVICDRSPGNMPGAGLLWNRSFVQPCLPMGRVFHEVGAGR